MNGVARLGLIRNVPEAQANAAIHNLNVRLIPAVRKQPGFVVGIWVSSATNDTGLSFTVFESQALGQAAGIAINSEPLLPEQVSVDIPSPDEVFNCEIAASVDNGTMPKIGRLAFTGKPANPQEAEMAGRWLSDEFMPFMKTLPGLCQAYMLNSLPDMLRISLTFWESEKVMQEAGGAIGRWSQQQAQEGRMGALEPGEVLTFPSVVDFVRGEMLTVKQVQGS